MTRAFLIAVCVVGTNQPTIAQDLDVLSTDIFRSLLKHQGLNSVSFEEASAAPGSTVVVIVGQLPASGDSRRELARVSRECLEQGGALLIASHGRNSLTPFFPRSDGGIAIDGRTVRDRSASLDLEGDVPFLTFDPTATLLEEDLAQMAILRRIATNRPSFIVTEKNSFPLIRLAEFSLSGRIDGPPTRLGPAIAVTPADRGIGVVIADSGVISNQWLAGRPPAGQEPLDNFSFAIRLASYLATGPNRTARRTQCVYWENDRRQTDFDRVSFAIKAPDIQPSWDAIQKTIIENADRKIHDLQQNDFPNRETQNPAVFRRILQSVSAIAAVVAVILLLRQIRGSRAANDETTAGIQASNESAVSLSAAMREQLRSQFAEWDAWHLPPSAVAVDGPRFYRKRMTRTVRRLLSLAFDENPEPLSANEWKRVWDDIEDLGEALRDGRVKFSKESRS